MKKKRPRVYMFSYNFSGQAFPIHLKIGLSGDVQTRLKQIQTPKEPFSCHYIDMHRYSSARRVERILHELLDDFKIRNEWFELKNIDDKSRATDLLSGFEEGYRATTGEYPWEEMKPKPDLRKKNK